MLPFLKRKEGGQSGVITQTRSPDQAEEGNDSDSERLACAQDLLRAIQADDAQGVADALYDAFTIMESEPHSEEEHVEPHSYSAQNIKAGQE